MTGTALETLREIAPMPPKHPNGAPQRAGTALTVQIRYRKRRFLDAIGTRLSAHGISLEVRSLTLPVGTQLDLEIRTPGIDWLVPATVIKQRPAGIDVRFRDPQPLLAREAARQGGLGDQPKPRAASAAAGSQVANPGHRASIASTSNWMAMNGSTPR